MLHLNFSGVPGSGKTTTARTLFDNFLGEYKEWTSGECTAAYVREALHRCDVLVLDNVGLGGRAADFGERLRGVVASARAARRLRCKLLITTSEWPIVLTDAEPAEGYMVMAQTLNNPKVMRE